MKKAAIFDLDGTLSDSIMSMKYSGDKTMAEFGYGPFSVQDYKYFVGDGAANLVKRALIKGGDTELTHFEAAYARYKEIFQANCMYQVKPYEGIPKLLEELKKRGMKFVGTTVIYAYLQAVGVLCSHEQGCFLANQEAEHYNSYS